MVPGEAGLRARVQTANLQAPRNEMWWLMMFSADPDTCHCAALCTSANLLKPEM